MRLVLDTNVVTSGFLRDGPPRQLLKVAREERLRLYTGPTLLLELADILTRPKFERSLAAAQMYIY